MQRSDFVWVGLALAIVAAAYALLGELAGLLAAAGIALGGGVAFVATWGRPGPAPPARVRKLARGTPAATGGPARAAAVSFLQARDGSRAAPRMEAGAALVPPRPAEARPLTDGILKGMHTGGKTTRGLCSQCGATIWLSARRPLKARCPVCNHTRVLT